MSSRREGGGGGKEVGIYASPTLPHSPDCDLHCKPARGSYRISLKKFCRKDYGRQPSSLLPLTFSPCTPHFPFGYPNPCWAPRYPPSLRSPTSAGPTGAASGGLFCCCEYPLCACPEPVGVLCPSSPPSHPAMSAVFLYMVHSLPA